MVACSTLAVCKWACLVAALLFFILYLLIRKRDGDNSRAIHQAEALLQAYHNEIAYLHGDYHAFADGKQYVDSSHPYSFDLDIFGPASLYQRLCRCVTTGGADRLASWLKGGFLQKAKDRHHSLIKDGQPKGDTTIDHLDQRADTIEELARHADFLMYFKACRPSIGSKAKPMSLLSTESLLHSLTNATKVQLPQRCTTAFSRWLRVLLLAGFYLSTAFAIAGLVSATLPLTWATFHLLFALTFPGNAVRRINIALEAVHKQLEGFNAITTLMEQESFEGDELLALRATIHEQARHMAELERILRDIDNRSNQIGILIFNVFALIDLGIVRRLASWQRTAAGYQDFVEALSTLDALVSLATYRANEPHGVLPEWVDSPTLVYEGRALRHPFLGRKAVANDAILADRHFYIITGANMAGKSTFLRTLGINVVLAQVGLPVCADSLRLSPFRLFTGMRTSDDLTHGISYFNAELLRLQQLIGTLDDTPTLVILDEILKGTNSRDKLNGSRLFLEYLAERNVTAVVATHDLELSHMADERPDRFHNYCFEIELGDSVAYSYRITPGTARNQNATFLLQKMLEKA